MIYTTGKTKYETVNSLTVIILFITFFLVPKCWFLMFHTLLSQAPSS